MTENTATKTKTTRSPRAPILPLEKALSRVQELYDVAGRHSALTADAAKCWGYGPKSSGGQQTIATLKMYGLLEDIGSGDVRKVQITKEAIDYLVDERPEKRAQARRDFALRPKILDGLWNVWKANPPGDSIARSQLRVDKGFNEKAANDLVKIYRENLRFAGLAGEAETPEGEEAEGQDEPQIEVGDFVQWESAGQLQFSQPRQVTWVSIDGSHLTVEGSTTGIPINEVQRVDAPATPPPPPPPVFPKFGPPPPEPKGGYQAAITEAEGRLQVNASVDKAGLKKLIRVLKAHLLELENDDAGSAEVEETKTA